MNIRLEHPKDYREVEHLTREAFWNVYRPGCTEHYVLNQYRTNLDFIPELDFVMEESGIIIGHVMFSKAELVLEDGSRKPSWTFGSISIHPDYKHKGYETCGECPDKNTCKKVAAIWENCAEAKKNLGGE